MVKIITELPIEKAIDKLSAEVFSSYFKINYESLVGEVNSKKVSLYRAVPFETNSFLPVFQGKFETVDGETILTGTWTYHWYIKLFTFLIASGMFYTFFDNFFNKHTLPIPSIIIDFIVVYVFWFLFKKSKKRALEDKNWIVKYVENILNS